VWGSVGSELIGANVGPGTAIHAYELEIHNNSPITSDDSGFKLLIDTSKRRIRPQNSSVRFGWPLVQRFYRAHALSDAVPLHRPHRCSHFHHRRSTDPCPQSAGHNISWTASLRVSTVSPFRLGESV
jgi:hypothetical protein